MAAPGVRYLGLYGLQEIRYGHVWVDPRLEAARPDVLAAKQDLRECAAVRDSGAYLEDKQYAVAIHTRRVADPTRWTAPIDEAARQVAERHGLEVVVGKLVWELRPAVRSDKVLVMLFGGSSASPTPAAWSWPGTISLTFLHLLRHLS